MMAMPLLILNIGLGLALLFKKEGIMKFKLALGCLVCVLVAFLCQFALNGFDINSTLEHFVFCLGNLDIGNYVNDLLWDLGVLSIAALTFFVCLWLMTPVPSRQ